MTTQSSASLTIDMITEDALSVLQTKLGFANRVLREFDDKFGVEGAKIGDTLRIRKPVRVQVTAGPSLNVQAASETYTAIQANNYVAAHFAFASKDLALTIDQFEDRYITPAMSSLAANVDLVGLQTVTSGSSVSNSGYYNGGNLVATYGGFFNLVTPGAVNAKTGPAAWTGGDLNSGANSSANAQAVFYQAKALLETQNAPINDRYCVLTPFAMACTAQWLTTIFNPQRVISETFETGLLPEIAGAKVFESQNMPQFTSGTWSNQANGAAANITVSVTSNNGDTVLSAGNIGANVLVNAGDQFVISNATAGVFAVNPQNYSSTGRLQIFVATATAQSNINGNVVINVLPAIYAGGQQYQTLTALPVAGMNLYFLGSNNTTTGVNIMYQKEAIALACVNLENVNGKGAACSVKTNPDSGLSLRYVEQYQSSSDLLNKRFDMLTGWAVPRPELGVRIQN